MTGSAATRTPDLLYSDVETDLRASVAGLLADRCAPGALLARCESADPHDLALWRTLAADVGVAGLLVPETLGGHGASVREAAVVAEELGRSVAPVPFLGSVALATTALLGADRNLPATTESLAALAAGELTGALTVPLTTAPGAAFPANVTLSADGHLHGRVGTVADAAVASLLVVPALGPEGPVLRAVDPREPGVRVRPIVPLDLTRPLADVTLDGVAARPLAGPDRAPDALDGALTTAAALLAAEQLGLAQWCLDETVRYVGQRYQFGRPVGSFQALKHRLADVWLGLVSARSAARYAADTLAAADPDVSVAAALAQCQCSALAVRAAEECVQLHGGIGMTWEHPAHLYLKRAKANELALGTPGAHRRRIASLVDLPPA